MNEAHADVLHLKVAHRGDLFDKLPIETWMKLSANAAHQCGAAKQYTVRNTFTVNIGDQGHSDGSNL